MTSLPIIVDDTRHSTGIEWVHMPGYKGVTWNVGKGCRRVSPGCGRGGGFKGGCYAERLAIRMSGPGGAYEGLVRSGPNGPRWTGAVRFDVETLKQPLRWRKPHMVFVDSMSDLFYEEFTNEQIAAVFGVMAACPQHVFIILTKRSERMPEWFGWLTGRMDAARAQYPNEDAPGLAAEALIGAGMKVADMPNVRPAAWPLPNVHLGVSVESREYLHRIDDLRRTPAATKVVSLEPLLEDLGDGLDLRGIHQALVGGESGPGAMPCEVQWIWRCIEAARRDGCAPFCKQLGAVPVIREATIDEQRNCLSRPLEHPEGEWPAGTGFGGIAGHPEYNGRRVILKDRKGGDPAEWPERFRVREWPKVLVSHG